MGANFTGHRCPGEHRTVGEHRAWCYNCAEWCYPRIPCTCCQSYVTVSEHDALRFLSGTDLSDDDVARILAMGAFHVEVVSDGR